MADKVTTDADTPFPPRKREPRVQVDKLRADLAKAVGLLFTLAAVVLALGVFLVAFRHNVTETNSLVKLVKNVADAIDGPFSRDNGIFHFSTTSTKQSAIDHAVTKNALFNWGLAAIVYLVIGRILARLIGPKH